MRWSKTSNFDGGRVAGEKFRRVRDLGARIAIDEFGSGYSNLSYALALSAITLKIDRSFVSDLRADRTADLTVSSIIDLSHQLGYAL